MNTEKKFFYAAAFPHSFPLHEDVKLKSIDSEVFKEDAILNVVGVVIFNQFDQLLINYSEKRKSWDIPQGVVELNDETLEAAASRELWEETGIKIAPDALYPILSFVNTGKTGIPEKFRTTLFMPIASQLITPDSIGIQEAEGKNNHLGFYSTNQIGFPRALSLRMILNL